MQEFMLAVTLMTAVVYGAAVLPWTDKELEASEDAFRALRDAIRSYFEK